MFREKIFFCVLSAMFFVGNPAFAEENKTATTKDVSTTQAAIKHFDSGDRQGAFLLLKTLENSGTVSSVPSR